MATDSIRFKLENAERLIRNLSTSLSQKASQIDSQIEVLLRGQNEIEGLLSDLTIIHNTLSEGTCPSLSLTEYETKLQSQFIELVTGTKFKTQYDVARVVAETTAQSESLIKRIQQWTQDGLCLMSESQAHIDEFRPDFSAE